eukprot:scaffold70763_cov32-Tisochrysis_lutea.AAC.5
MALHAHTQNSQYLASCKGPPPRTCSYPYCTGLRVIDYGEDAAALRADVTLAMGRRSDQTDAGAWQPSKLVMAHLG